MSLPFKVISFIFFTVSPNLFAFALLHVVLPRAFIPRSINMMNGAVAIGLIIPPIAFVNTTIDVSEFAVALSMPKLPTSFINCAICPFHLALTNTEPTLPCAFVFRTCLVRVKWSSLYCRSRIPHDTPKCFISFL